MGNNNVTKYADKNLDGEITDKVKNIHDLVRIIIF